MVGGENMTEKVMIFIDGANLFHGSRAYEAGYKVDILKLVDELVDNRKLIRAYFYDSLPVEDQNKIIGQKNFHNLLEYNGFKVTALPLRKRQITYDCEGCGRQNSFEKNVEKGVDIALVTDMLLFGIMRYYDTGIIVSGDLDYFRAIEEVQRRGVKIEIAYFRDGGISGELIRQADKFIDLGKIAEKIRK